MKTFILLGLLVLFASAEDMTMKKFKECIAKEETAGTTCDTSCQEEYKLECLHDTDVYNNVDCKYWFRNVEMDENKEWSDDMAIAFHNCWDLCKDEVSGATETYI